MGPGAADIAQIIPVVRDKFPGLPPPPALDLPEANRFRLFDSITTFLKNATQFQPLVLILDDLHWADQPSLLLLQFLARHVADSRLLVVGCYREVELSRQHPLSQALGHLSREPVFRRVPLRGLDLEDTELFIQAITGIQPGQGLAGTIYERTEGNPFFMTEVVRLLSDQGGLTGQEAGGPLGVEVPEGVRAAIGLRLNRLSDACNQVLTTAAIIGREFDFKLLCVLSDGIAEAQQLEAIDQALAAHLIQELPGKQLSLTSRVLNVRVPGLSMLDHRVQDDQELAHAGCQSYLSGFACLTKAVVKGLDDGVIPAGSQSRHIEGSPHPGPSTPDHSFAPEAATVPIKRGNSHQGGNLVAAQSAQFRKISQQGDGHYPADPRDATQQVVLFSPEGTLPQGAFQVIIQVSQLLFQPADMVLNSPMHQFSRGPQPILFGSKHLDHLVAPSQEGSQFLSLGIW